MHGLDTLRAAAIVAVMVFHLQEYLPAALEPVAGVGWMGVDLFFVLSGFLIGSQLLQPYAPGVVMGGPTAGRIRVGEFYARRAYRILPAFAVVLALYLAVPVWREAPGLAAWWKFATFSWNLSLGTYPEDRAFSHVWSLCVEEHFYLLLPALLLWQMKKPGVGRTVTCVVAIVLGGMAVRAWIAVHGVRVATAQGTPAWLPVMKGIYYPTYSRLDGLVAGVVVALVRTFRSEWWAWMAARGNWLLVGGAWLVAWASWLFAWGYPQAEQVAGLVAGFPLLALGFGLMVGAGAGRGGLLGVKVPGAAWVATVSYSLYLTHKEVAHVDRVLWPKLLAQPSWVGTGVYAVTCGAVAAGLYFGVERPFLWLKARRMTAWPGEVRAAAVDLDGRMDPAVWRWRREIQVSVALVVMLLWLGTAWGVRGTRVPMFQAKYLAD